MITYQIVIPPSNGTAVIVGDEARYTSNQGYVGSDSFTYRKLDDGVEVVQRKVCITVEQGNFPKEWRPSGSSCEVINGMITGELVYSTLAEYDTFTGLPTGLTKPNSVGDPDYVPPIFDSVSCPASVGWRPIESSAYCEIGSNTGNTGKKIYTELEQYYLINGVLTGLTKANTVGDPNYVAPVEDLSKCPVGVTYTAVRSEQFYRATCPAGQYALPIGFSKTYTSVISQSDANNQAANDPNFNLEGQLYANANGFCSLIDTRSQFNVLFMAFECMMSGSQVRSIFTTQQEYENLDNVPQVINGNNIFFYKDAAGTIPVDAGWYYGLSNNKSFYANADGEVTHYWPCDNAPNTLLLYATLEGNLIVPRAKLSAPFHSVITITGRIDGNPFVPTNVGADFSITIPPGSTDGADTDLVFERMPSMAYTWQSYQVTPDEFIVTKHEPI